MKNKVDWMLDTKAGESLLNLLLSDSVFSEEPKMATKALELLVDIYGRIPNSKQDYDWGISYKEFQNTFRGAKNNSKFVKALIKLGLLELTQKKVAPSPFSKGRTNRYRFTKRFKDAYYKSVRENEELYNPEELLCVRKLGKKRTRRLREAQKIMDVFQREHEVLSCTVEVDMVRLRKESESSKKDQALAIVGQLRRVEIKVSEPNSESSRLYHTLANFPSIFRKYLRVGDKRYCAEIDIRACWATYLAAQLMHKEPSNDALKAECVKWQEMFCDPSKDPRQTIKEESRLSVTTGDIKDTLNKYLSGYTEIKAGEHRTLKPVYSVLDDWFANRYPAMYTAWKKAKPSKFGRLVGIKFETPLMTDPRIYSLAKKQDVILCYQSDGFGIFASPMSKSELEKILVSICELMQDISIKKFGVPIVVKTEQFIVL